MDKIKKLETDLRLILAHQQTLMGWVRVALAFQAGGVALAHFGNDSRNLVVTGILTLILGAIIAVIGFVRYKAANKAVGAGHISRFDIWPTVEVIIIVLIAVVLARTWAKDIF